MAASLPYYKGLRIRRQAQWPHVESWFVAMEARPSYRNIASDFYTHVHDLPPQIGRCQSSGDEASALADQVHKRYVCIIYIYISPPTSTCTSTTTSADRSLSVQWRRRERDCRSGAQALYMYNIHIYIASDFYTHVHDLPPQIGRCQSSGADASAIADQVLGPYKTLFCF